MYLEQVYNPITGEVKYIDGSGDQITDFLVFVDGRHVVADIRRLDTDENWVDIELPPITKTIKVGELELGAAEELYEVNIKRLIGKVELRIAPRK